MSDSSYVQSSFLAGEWSPFAQGRTDDKDYRRALNVCRNGYPLEEGAWIRRSGSRFGHTTLGGAAGRVMGFDFAAFPSYVMEFTASALRFHAIAALTGQITTQLPSDFRLVSTNDNQQIVSISTATPAVVETNTTHLWTTNNQVEFHFDSSLDQSFTPLLRNRLFKITPTDATHFSIADAITGTSIDGSALGWASVTAGQVIASRILAITTPYTGTQWQTLRSVQAETQAFLLHGSYLPRSLSVTALPTATAFATFALATSSFTDGPYLDPPIDGSTLTPSTTTGTISVTASGIGSINEGSGFLSTDVGRSVRLFSQPATWSAGVTYSAGQSVTFNSAFFTATVSANVGQQPDIAIAYWALNPAAATWTWGRITSVGSTSVCAISIQGANLLYTAAIKIWRLGVYSDTTGYPTCGCYYEGRIWLSGVVDNRVDASVVNGISGSTIDMTPTAADGTVSDANAISYVFNADKVNPIYWMIGTTRGIVCGAFGGEWLIQASQLSDPITATSIQAHRGTTYGSENIEAQDTQATICFVQRYGRSILEYFPDVFSGKFTAPNLTQKAKHLTKPGIAEIRYQQELLPLIWARLDDGSLIGATYERNSLISSQGPEFCGWHRHDLGSGRTVESITIGPSSDGSLDALCFVSTDASNLRHVEFMENIFNVNDNITSGWLQDDAIVPSTGVISGTTLTLYGMWHLVGKTVAVSVGGIDCGQFLVAADGSVAVPIGLDASDLLTVAYLASISNASSYGAKGCIIKYLTTTYTVPAVVGFTYTSQGQLLRPDTVEQSRSPTGPALGKPRRLHQFAVLLAGAQGVSFGTSFTAGKMNAALFKTAGNTPYTALQLYSGVYWSPIMDDYGFDGMLCWQITRPYPCALAGLNAFANFQDR